MLQARGLALGDDLLDKPHQGEDRRLGLDGSRLQPRHVEERFQQAIERRQRPFDMGQDRRHQLIGPHLRIQDRHLEDERLDRLAEIVAGGGQEFGFGEIGPFGGLFGQP